MDIALNLLGLLMLAAVNGIMYAGWVALCLPQPWSLGRVQLVASIGWCCQVLAAHMLLGLVGLLDAWALLVANLAVTSGLLIVARRDLARHLPARWQSVKRAWDEASGSPALVTCAFLLLVWLGWTVFLATIFPPYAADEHYYHMPIVASLIQRHDLGPITSHIPWIQAYPKNGELFSVWNSILLGRDTYADLAMAPFALVGGLGVYVAGRQLGASLANAALGACVLLFAPVLMIQLKTTYVDVLVGAMWAAALGLALPPVDGSPRRSLPLTALLLGLIGGIIAGTKFTGLVYLPVLALLLVPLLLANWAPRQVVRAALLFGLGALLMCGLWYGQNLVRFGNPVWPFTVQVGGNVLLPGQMNPQAFAESDRSLEIVGAMPVWQRLLYAWFEPTDAYAVDSRLGGLGPLWIVLGVPATLCWGVWAVRRRRWVPLLLIALHGLLLAVTPFNWQPRYTLFLLALGGCALAWTMTALSSWGKRFVAALIAVLALYACVNSVDHRFFSNERIRTFVALPNAERTGMSFSPETFGPAYRWVEQHVGGDDIIAYSGGVWRIYPLWGSSFGRRVIGVGDPDITRYLADLRAANVRYVFVLAGNEKAQTLAASDAWQLVFDDGTTYQIYEARR